MNEIWIVLALFSVAQSAHAFPGSCIERTVIIPLTLAGEAYVSATEYLSELSALRKRKDAAVSEGCGYVESKYFILPGGEVLKTEDNKTSYTCIAKNWFEKQGQIQEQRMRLRKAEENFYQKLNALNVSYPFFASPEELANDVGFGGSLVKAEFDKDYRVDHVKCDPSKIMF